MIDGDSSGSVVTFENGEDSMAVMTGFTIQNGENDLGGGIHFESSSPYLMNIIVKDHASEITKDRNFNIKISLYLLINIRLSASE